MQQLFIFAASSKKQIWALFDSMFLYCRLIARSAEQSADVMFRFLIWFRRKTLSSPVCVMFTRRFKHSCTARKTFFGKLDDSTLSLDANLLKMNGWGVRWSLFTMYHNMQFNGFRFYFASSIVNKRQGYNNQRGIILL